MAVRKLILLHKYTTQLRYPVIQTGGNHLGRVGLIIGERPGGLLVMQYDYRGKPRRTDILPKNVQRIDR